MTKATGIVTATELNVRKTASTDLPKIGSLFQGERVDILVQSGNWLQIVYDAGDDGTAYVGARHVKLIDVPARTTATSITQSGSNLFANGAKFGKIVDYGSFSGVQCNGTTSVLKFLNDHPGAFPDLSDSLIRVANLVILNEGTLEAVNSYDSAFISFGVLQWTAGTGDRGGELAAILARLKREDPKLFAFYFGQYGLDVVVASSTATDGRLKLNGVTLMTAADKTPLRAPIWAHRFWRAGHDIDVRKVEINHAMGRVRTFYIRSNDQLGGYALSDWITSEVGVAHLLDEHTNRPGHVPGCIGKAIAEQRAKPGKNTPASWTNTDERDVLARYIVLRETYFIVVNNKSTSPMTQSTQRANRIIAAANAGKLSAQRGSFSL